VREREALSHLGKMDIPLSIPQFPNPVRNHGKLLLSFPLQFTESSSLPLKNFISQKSISERLSREFVQAIFVYLYILFEYGTSRFHFSPHGYAKKPQSDFLYLPKLFGPTARFNVLFLAVVTGLYTFILAHIHNPASILRNRRSYLPPRTFCAQLQVCYSVRGTPWYS